MVERSGPLPGLQRTSPTGATRNGQAPRPKGTTAQGSGLKRTESGLWVANGLNFLRYRATKRTVTLPNGERALVTVDDSGTVTQVEHGDELDAIVRPKTVKLKIRRVG